MPWLENAVAAGQTSDVACANEISKFERAMANIVLDACQLTRITKAQCDPARTREGVARYRVLLLLVLDDPAQNDSLQDAP